MQKEKMLKGELYTIDSELKQEMQDAQELVKQYNQLSIHQNEEQEAMIRQLFGRVGENPEVTAPIYCDYGKQVSIGDHFYSNYGCSFVDVATITIGNHVFLGPHVHLLTPSHPISADIRNTGVEYAKPITIGDSVWIGGNVTVNPGVTIGSRSIIGSGSVVTKDIPEDVIAVGNPCRVLRAITDEDNHYWEDAYSDYMNK